jgi:hypothetical protein
MLIENAEAIAGVDGVDMLAVDVDDGMPKFERIRGVPQSSPRFFGFYAFPISIAPLVAS